LRDSKRNSRRTNVRKSAHDVRGREWRRLEESKQEVCERKANPPLSVFTSVYSDNQ